jgi:hypothetical protein
MPHRFITVRKIVKVNQLDLEFLKLVVFNFPAKNVFHAPFNILAMFQISIWIGF